MGKQISVIVLVYNAEEYIERCACSLFNQTLTDIEYIFVDDCSTDRSVEILEVVINQYPSRKHQVKVIHNERNMKQAYCRTAGMQAATGEYIIHCDSDDWVDEDLYENMYEKAKLTGADIVTCNVTIHRKREISKICYNYEGKPLDCLKEMKFNNYGCNKLIKRELIEQYSIYPFPGINCGEDLNIIVRALSHAKSITYIQQAGYHYWRNNAQSITMRSPLQNFEEYLFKDIEMISEYIYSINLPDAEKIIAFIKLDQRGMLLWATSQGTYRSVKAWTKIWPETNKYITDYPGSSANQTKFVSLFCNQPFLLWCFVKSFRHYVKLKLYHKRSS